MAHRVRQVSVDRIVAAPPAAVFAALREPAVHSAIDGSGTLLPDAAGGSGPSLQAGSVFITGMSRRLRHLSRVDVVQVAVAMLVRGRMRNTVVEFDENRRIAWRNFGRHVWRFELEPMERPTGMHTRVRETFDYEPNPAPWFLEWAGFPTRNRAAMTDTLAALDDLVGTR